MALGTSEWGWVREIRATQRVCCAIWSCSAVREEIEKWHSETTVELGPSNFMTVESNNTFFLKKNGDLSFLISFFYQFILTPFTKAWAQAD